MYRLAWQKSWNKREKDIGCTWGYTLKEPSFWPITPHLIPNPSKLMWFAIPNMLRVQYWTMRKRTTFYTFGWQDNATSDSFLSTWTVLRILSYIQPRHILANDHVINQACTRYCLWIDLVIWLLEHPEERFSISWLCNFLKQHGLAEAKIQCTCRAVEVEKEKREKRTRKSLLSAYWNSPSSSRLSLWRNSWRFLCQTNRGYVIAQNLVKFGPTSADTRSHPVFTLFSDRDCLTWYIIGGYFNRRVLLRLAAHSKSTLCISCTWFLAD